jgi:hypothetical protein
VPVVECSCGMVMSHSVSQPRTNCIRCGSDAIRELDLGRAALVSNQSPQGMLAVGGADRQDSMPPVTAETAVFDVVVGSSPSVAREVLMNRDLNN